MLGRLASLAFVATAAMPNLALAASNVSSALIDHANCEAMLCWPIIDRDRQEWWTRHYVMPGVHHAMGRDGTTHGAELRWRVRPMATIGWASLYYEATPERQVGVLLKLPIRLSQ